MKNVNLTFTFVDGILVWNRPCNPVASPKIRPQPSQ